MLDCRANLLKYRICYISSEKFRSGINKETAQNVSSNAFYQLGVFFIVNCFEETVEMYYPKCMYKYHNFLNFFGTSNLKFFESEGLRDY